MSLILSGTDGLSDVDGSAATPAIRGTDANTGIFFPAADTIAFAEGGAEVARFDSSGNLGLGTTSPSAKLHVAGTVIIDNADANNELTFSGTQFTNVLSATTSGFQFGTTGAGYLAFLTSNTERARIDSSGNLLVGLTSVFNGTNCPLQVSNSSNNQVFALRNTNATPYGIYAHYSGASPNNTTNEFLYCNDTVSLKTSIRSNGGIANYSGNNVNLSDRREKTNFAPAKSYLDVICAIPVQTFNYIDQNLEEDGGLTLGVVAQDVQAVAPELVMESNWASKDEEPKMRLSIYQTDLQYALMKCIQEQQAIINSLKARLDAANL